ncbi:hypothetical protein PD374_07290 [Pseudomonas sp. WCS374]|nr:hypothetical protein PD374_07290 [Pseudomonas sp. WCS374]
MLLVLERELFLGGQALVLFGRLLTPGLASDCIQFRLVAGALLRNTLSHLLAQTPVLNLPCPAKADAQRQQDCQPQADQLLHRRHHGTSLKNTW